MSCSQAQDESLRSQKTGSRKGSSQDEKTVPLLPSEVQEERQAAQEEGSKSLSLLNSILGEKSKGRRLPPWIWKRRVGMYLRVHAAIYGHTVKGTDGSVLNRWCNAIGHYCGKGHLRYGEVLRVAIAFGKDLKARRAWLPEIYQRNIDFTLFRRFCDLLIARAEAAQAAEPDRLEEFKDGREAYLIAAWQREALLNGLCPRCGADVSQGDPCGHGYGRPAQDGCGGVVVDG